MFVLAAAALVAAGKAETPRYVAVELSLDGAVRDAAASARNELVGSRGAETGETHAVVRRGDDLVDLHPAGASFSRAMAGDDALQAGSAGIGGHSHAMLWQGAADGVLDLHEFLPGSYTESAATGIDDAGNVTGVAIDGDGVAHDILRRPAAPHANASASTNSGGAKSGGGNTGGGAVAADKVSITRALWFANPQAPPTGELLVQATSSRPDAVLTLSDSVTGAFIATLPNLGGGRYGGTVIFRFNPVTSVTVTSNLGGSNSRTVIAGVQ